MSSVQILRSPQEVRAPITVDPMGRGSVQPVRVERMGPWTLADCAALADRAWAGAQAVLPVRADGADVLIGPLQHAGAPVCLECVEHSRTTAKFGTSARDEVRRDGACAPIAQDLLGEVISLAIQAGRAADGQVWVLDGLSLEVTTRRARPRHTGCSRCHPLGLDGPEPASAPRRCGVPCDPATLRSANDRTTPARLRAAMVDQGFGPVRRLGRSDRICLPIAYAEVADRRLDGDGGYGRATRFLDAERVALFEALERITGMRPGRRQTHLRASLRELGTDVALDPRALGQYEPEAMQHPRFALAPFSEDLPLDWVWGHSQRTGGPIAVPEQAAYWGVPAPRGQGVLAESSNGCGLGNSLEEAALYGLFELIERDAFLIAWWAGASLPRIAFPSRDPFLGMIRGRLDSLDYDVILLDATSDMAVPVVVAVAVHRDPAGDAPAVFVTAGAHLRRSDAIRSALVEVVVNVEHAPHQARQTAGAFDRRRLWPMLEDPALVETIDDHVGVNALREARGRFESLLSGPSSPAGETSWGSVDASRDWSATAAGGRDVAAILEQVRQRALQVGVDTVIVDQTPSWVERELGLYAARVIAPGLVSLTFGHVYRRTRGLPRLLSVPYQQGWVGALPAYEALPFHPHPFP